MLVTTGDVRHHDRVSVVLLSHNPVAAAGLQAQLGNGVDSRHQVIWAEELEEAVPLHPNLLLFDLDSITDEMPWLWYEAARVLPAVGGLCLQSDAGTNRPNSLPTFVLSKRTIAVLPLILRLLTRGEMLLPMMPPKDRPASYLGELSSRQAEILGLVSSGLTDREIAARLGLSFHTVRWHLRQIYGALGVRGRAAAACFFRTVA